MKETDIEEVKIRNYDYYRTYENNIITENLVVSILSQLKMVLQEYGIKINTIECVIENETADPSR